MYVMEYGSLSNVLWIMSGKSDPDIVQRCPLTHVAGDCQCFHLLEILNFIWERVGAWVEHAGGRIDMSSTCPLACYEFSG